MSEKRKYWAFQLAVLILLTLTAAIGSGQQVRVERKPKFIKNGQKTLPFEVTRHIVPLRQIEGGGPPRDGIPALIDPEYIPAEEAGRLLEPSDRVLGVLFNGEARAYPIRILNWHELVNDTVGGRPILVSWCPLCGSGVVYDPMIGGRRHIFGVSGLLYKRNLLFFDRQTGSLWSQLLSEAVTGPMAGTKLHALPAEDTTWKNWESPHPDTLVLSFATGYQRDYRADPYAAMPLARDPALFVAAEGEAEIFPFSQLHKAQTPVTEQLAGQRFIIRFEPHSKTARVESESPGRITWFVGFKEDLRHFFPKAQVYHFRKSKRRSNESNGI